LKLKRDDLSYLFVCICTSMTIGETLGCWLVPSNPNSTTSMKEQNSYTI